MAFISFHFSHALCICTRSGQIPTLEYVSQDDIDSERVQVIPKADRVRSSLLTSVDAPDIQQVQRSQEEVLRNVDAKAKIGQPAMVCK